MSFGYVVIDPTSNDSHIEDFLKSPACIQCLYACQAKMKFECFKWEIHYMMKVFHVTHKKFLTMVDHIDYHPSRIQKIQEQKEVSYMICIDNIILRQKY